MFLHDLELVRGELVGLQQDAVGNADLAHVVQRGRMRDQFHGLFVQAQFPGDDFGVASHADHVPARLVVAVFRGPGQAMDQFQPRGGQLRGPPPDLLLQVVRRSFSDDHGAP